LPYAKRDSPGGYFAHGITNHQEALASALTLGNGSVTVRDLIMRVKPSLDGGLATLAVCRGALPQDFGQVDGWSLATAFFHLKAEAVIASIWELDEDFAAAYFGEFYRRYGEPGVDSNHAFIKALRPDNRAGPAFTTPGILGYDSPCFWGGLVHIGW
jgi:CHAT domain-containing protein